MFKTLRERADEALFRRGIDNGESDFFEGASELDGDRSMEEFGDDVSVISEGTATPRTED